MGMITAFGFTYAPQGWAQCNGQMLSIAQNSALFALLGTTYGGNGQTTFQLPNLQSRVPVGAGQGQGLSAYQIGQVGGVESVAMTINNLPQHTHNATAQSTSTPTVALNGVNAAATVANPLGHMLAASPTKMYAPSAGNTPAAMDAASITASTTTATTVTVSPTGNSQPVSVLQPYLALNYCICTQGIFPSRN